MTPLRVELSDEIHEKQFIWVGFITTGFHNQLKFLEAWVPVFPEMPIFWIII
jgi:hypothetical protein